MCGLYGWVRAGKLTGKPDTVSHVLALSLAVANDRRGGDSWGFYAAAGGRRKRPGTLVKGVGRSTGMADGLGVAGGAGLLIGHTRKATTGKVNADNSHPWTVKGVTFAHNGIVWNHTRLNAAHPERGCEVDSQHIGHCLADGVCLSTLEAYGAITYTREGDPGAVYMGTFHGGELDVRTVPGFGMVWSSSTWHLDECLALAGLAEGQSFKLDDGELYRVPASGDGLFKAGALPVSSPTADTTAARLFTSGKGTSIYVDTPGTRKRRKRKGKGSARVSHLTDDDLGLAYDFDGLGTDDPMPTLTDDGITQAELDAADLSMEDVDRYGLTRRDVLDIAHDWVNSNGHHNPAARNGGPF